MLHSVVYYLVLTTLYVLIVGVGVTFHLVTLNETVSKTPLHGGSGLCRDLNLTTHNTHKRQISISPMGFEPTIPASERQHKHALNYAAIAEWKHITVNFVYGRR
jgi:ABC-type protease/lipase transport system fused ATPase/permease subunit